MPTSKRSKKSKENNWILGEKNSNFKTNFLEKVTVFKQTELDSTKHYP